MFLVSIVLSFKETPVHQKFQHNLIPDPAAFAEASKAPELFRSSLAADPDLASREGFSMWD